MENFTNDELRTMCWMCESKGAEIQKRHRVAYIQGDEKTPVSEMLRNDKTYQRILSISRKAYAELISREGE